MKDGVIHPIYHFSKHSPGKQALHNPQPYSSPGLHPVNSTFKLPLQAMYVPIVYLTNLCQLSPSKNTSSWFSVAPPLILHPSSPLNSASQPSCLFQALRQAHLTPDVTSAREGAPDSYGPARRGARPPTPHNFRPALH